MGYAPLELLAKSEQPGREFEVRKEQFAELGLKNAENITEPEFVSFLLSENFMNPEYEGMFAPINYLFATNISTLADFFGCSVAELRKKDIDIATEWRDLYLAPCLLDRWAKNKQVYKPDAEFADALLHTKNLEIAQSQVKHLPCKSFYIDLSACNGYDPIVGMFVFIDEIENGLNIAEYLLTDELVYFSFYIGGFYKDGIIKLAASEIDDHADYEVYIPNLPQYKSQTDLVYNSEKDRKSTTLLGIQLLSYISSKEPDIYESSVTKKTYRPGKTIKNRFSEVQEWEVGIRYGNSIRTRIKEEQRATMKTDVPPVNYKEQTRKSPIPHFRCAHWQHYWTGKGRKICEVRWIEPVFVGFGDREKAAKDVVIHKVGM